MRIFPAAFSHGPTTTTIFWWPQKSSILVSKADHNLEQTMAERQEDQFVSASSSPIHHSVDPSINSMDFLETASTNGSTDDTFFLLTEDHFDNEDDNNIRIDNCSSFLSDEEACEVSFLQSKCQWLTIVYHLLMSLFKHETAAHR